MLGKGDSDFILGKKKKKEKKNKTKKKTASHLSKKTLIDKTLEHTLRQLKKKLWRRRTDCLSASRHRELKSTATDKTSVFLSGLRK